MKYFFICFYISLNYIVFCDGNELKGHGEPIGSHRPSDGHIDILSFFPTPKQFWDEYMRKGKPCLLKGAAKTFPAISKWTNEYLTKHYGDLEVKLEHKYEKKDTPVGSKGVGRDTIREFLKTYKNEPKYIVSQLPDPMAKDVYVLPILTCGSYKERLLEANLWLSSGGSKSLLHKDADNAINCLLNGTKEWTLIHPSFTKFIPVAEGDKGYGGFATLNVEKVNLKKYSQFQHVHYNHVNMAPGDCLFLPKGYWHQVNSYGTQNLAVSVLFSRLKEFDNTGCENPDKLKYVPLSESGMVWTYPGFGPQTLGNLDPFELRENLFEMMRRVGKSQLVTEDLEHFYEGDEDEDYGSNSSFEQEKQLLGQTLLRIFDLKGKEYIDKNDIQSLTIQQLKNAAQAIDPDPANTAEYEYFIFKPERISSLIRESVNDKGYLEKDILIVNYMKLGGSNAMGQKIFETLLNGKISEEIDQKTIDDNIAMVIENFSRSYTSTDKSGTFYEKEFQEDSQSISPNDQRMKSTEEEDDHEDEYPEHEPIYQPEDQGYEEIDNYISPPDNQEPISEYGSPSNTENTADYLDEVEEFVDENEDGYPDHEPIYQPEDELNDYNHDETEEYHHDDFKIKRDEL